MAVVYIHRRADIEDSFLNVFYVGIAKVIKRPYSKQGRNTYWKRIVNKYRFTVEILYNNLTWEEACIKEIELIKFYGRYIIKSGNLVNITEGGEGTTGFTKNHTEETKQRIGKSLKGRTFSKEHIEKLKQVKGIRHHNFGKRGSETKSFGRRNSDEVKKQMSINSIGKGLGRKMTEDQKKTLSESRKGDKSYLFGKFGKDHPMYGRKVNDEQKQKISENLKNYFKSHKPSSCKKVMYINQETNEIIQTFMSIKDATIHTNVSKYKILKSCNNQTNITKSNYIWKLIN